LEVEVGEEQEVNPTKIKDKRLKTKEYEQKNKILFFIAFFPMTFRVY